MAILYVITSCYPYLPGEQFIEDEVSYWEKARFSKVIILPCSAQGLPRETPDSVEISRILSPSYGGLKLILSNILCAGLAVIERPFRTEVRWLYENNKLNLSNVVSLIKALMLTAKHQSKLESIVSNTDDAVFYCYWNDVASYAVANLKEKYPDIKLITRAHGFDLYERRRPGCYMPLKRQLVNRYDRVYFLSEEGRSYYIKNYALSKAKSAIAPLGVPIPETVSTGNNHGRFHVVSLSFCVQVKRIDRIIDAVYLFAKKYKDVNVQWTHIGDGPLFDSLVKRAVERFNGVRNLEFNFIGNLPNTEAREFLTKENIDVFVNASESEGMPVSIMEAMSAGVPAIAPSIGGISEMVNDKTGVLMGSDIDPLSILSALESIYLEEDRAIRRHNARVKIKDEFNADKNYRSFISNLDELIS